MPIKSFAVVRSDRRGMIRNLTKEAPAEPTPLFFHCLALPDHGSHRIRPYHRISGLASECRGKLRHVGQRAIRSPLTRRVRIGVDANALRFRRDVLPPDLRPRQEESLLRRKAIDIRRAPFLGEGLLECSVRDRETSQIGEILTQRQFAVYVQAVEHRVRIELRCDQTRSCLELRQIGGTPPVAEIALRVELRALVVEAVSHLVTDDGAHAAIVDGVVGVWIEERGLHDASGKHDLVHRGIVVRIYRWWCHPPFGAIDGLSDLGQRAPPLVLTYGDLVFQKMARLYRQSRIVAPLNWT